MSFKPYTEKIKKKKIGICSILGRIRIRIRNTGVYQVKKRPTLSSYNIHYTVATKWKSLMYQKLRKLID